MDGETLSNSSRVTFHNAVVSENGLHFIRSTLELCSVTVSDEGEYGCEVRNTVGSSNASFYLTVLGKCV